MIIEPLDTDVSVMESIDNTTPTSTTNSNRNNTDRNTITSLTIGTLIFHLREIGVYICGVSPEKGVGNIIPLRSNYSIDDTNIEKKSMSAYIRPIAYAAVGAL